MAEAQPSRKRPLCFTRTRTVVSHVPRQKSRTDASAHGAVVQGRPKAELKAERSGAPRAASPLQGEGTRTSSSAPPGPASQLQGRDQDFLYLRPHPSSRGCGGPGPLLHLRPASQPRGGADQTSSSVPPGQRPQLQGLAVDQYLLFCTGDSWSDTVSGTQPPGMTHPRGTRETDALPLLGG